MMKVLGALTSTVVALVSLVPSASAQTAAAPDCQFGNTYGVVVDRAYLRTQTGNVAIGKIQLCRDSDYKYWGFVLLNNPLTTSQWADAVLTRYRDGLQGSISCDSPGGNGKVLPGQTRCWTPKFTGLSRLYTFRAEATVTSSHTGDWYAWGSTSQTR
ncbi:hypothetical protein [Amycolatopsis sp. NPDC059657]|uniref:hypothetical protein n=1 Tax=Amycolatopsis sp. NPDC059657 TaxID=3346899 RepID=UPI00366F67D0